MCFFQSKVGEFGGGSGSGVGGTGTPGGAGVGPGAGLKRTAQPGKQPGQDTSYVCVD